MALQKKYSKDFLIETRIIKSKHFSKWKKQFNIELLKYVDDIASGRLHTNSYHFITPRKTDFKRFILMKKYEVFYTIANGKLIITHIIDGRMDIEHMSDSVLSKKSIKQG